VSGAKGDVLMFTPKGDVAFFDGFVKPGSRLNNAGAATTRSVFEAKLWGYENYEPWKKKAELSQLKIDTAHDLSVARQCKYTYSLVVSSAALRTDFILRNANIKTYYIPFV
jgi:hypothetical protein